MPTPRMSVARGALLLALAMTSIGSCGFGGAAEQSFGRQADASCYFYFNCCSAPERAYLGVGGNTVGSNQQECVTKLSEEGQDGTLLIADAEAEGRLEWDDEAWEACNGPTLEALRGCDYEALTTQTPDAECASSPWLVGLVANGDTCFADYECEDDEAECVSVQSLQDPDDETVIVSAAGECVPPAEEGDSCDDLPCRSGLLCQYDGEGLDLICVALPDAGEACPDFLCQGDAYCDAEQVCRARRVDGTVCTADNQCRSGRCDPDPDGNATTPVCEETCAYSDDGQCDDGGPGSGFSICDLGTDCLDCGVRDVGELVCTPLDQPDVADVEYDICMADDGT